MSSPLVSFVVPARNEERALPLTVDHIRRIARRFTHEIVIVDDASSCPASALFTPEQRRTLRIERVETRIGVARARALGSSSATGEFLFHLDSHVCFDPDTVSSLLTEQERAGDSILGTSLYHTSDWGLFETCARGGWQVGETDWTFGWKVALTPLPWIVPRATREEGGPFPVPIVGAAGMWLPARVYRMLGGFFTGLTGYGSVEDTELCLSAWACGAQVLLVPNARCLHFIDPAQRKLKESATPGHDHPQYDEGSFNAARVARLHLPVSTFLESGYTDAELAAIPSREFTERSERLERQRLRAREEVLEIALDARDITTPEPGRAGIVIDTARDRSRLDSFEHVVCCSHDLFECLEGTTSSRLHRLSSPSSDGRGLDALCRYYRPEVWSRAFDTRDAERFRAFPAEGARHVEDIVLQYSAPFWYREDLLGSLLAAHRVSRLELAIENPLLDFHFRRFLERRGRLYGVEASRP